MNVLFLHFNKNLFCNYHKCIGSISTGWMKLILQITPIKELRPAECTRLNNDKLNQETLKRFNLLLLISS
jgi:hypothetical protein